MKNKTCGACLYYDAPFCDFHAMKVASTRKSCDLFDPKEKPPTNGDVIRQGGNRDFAEYFVYETGAVFASTLIVDKTFDTYDEAVDATMDYLNAPAESEGEDDTARN